MLNGLFVDEKGTMRIRQGDSGSFKIKGIPADKNYKVYFAVFDPVTGEIVSPELYVPSNLSPEVLVELSKDFTTSLQGTEKGRRYSYGIKLCYEEKEETIVPSVVKDSRGVSYMQRSPDFVVYSAKVEGD